MGVGYGHMSLGNMEESGAALDEAIAFGERAQHDFLRSLSMSMKGLQLFVCDALDAGFDLLTQARRIQTRIGDDEGVYRLINQTHNSKLVARCSGRDLTNRQHAQQQEPRAALAK